MERTDTERMEFLNLCALAMEAITGLRFEPFTPHDRFLNRHVWLNQATMTGFAVVAYKAGTVSVHLYSESSTVIEEMVAVEAAAKSGGIATLPEHMRLRLKTRKAQKKRGKVYLEFVWHADGQLTESIQDVESATRFLNPVRESFM